MPEKELMLLIETLVKQIQAVSDGQENLRKYVIEQFVSMQGELHHYVLKEDMNDMEDKVVRIEKKLDDMQQKIIENQEQKFKQTIQVQATILLLIIGGFITSYFIPQLLHLFGH